MPNLHQVQNQSSSLTVLSQLKSDEPEAAGHSSAESDAAHMIEIGGIMEGSSCSYWNLYTYLWDALAYHDQRILKQVAPRCDNETLIGLCETLGAITENESAKQLVTIPDVGLTGRLSHSWRDLFDVMVFAIYNAGPALLTWLYSHGKDPRGDMLLTESLVIACNVVSASGIAVNEAFSSTARELALRARAEFALQIVCNRKQRLPEIPGPNTWSGEKFPASPAVRTKSPQPSKKAVTKRRISNN